MIFKRTQYRKDGPRVRLTTIRQVEGTRDYLDDAEHPNHLSVTMGGVEHWRTTEAQFLKEIETQAAAYKAKPKGPGQPWGGEITEHVVYAPPPGSAFTDVERTQIALFVLPRICPNSPAVYAWHIGDDGRDELHILASNFIDDTFPDLRITTLRNEHDADYRLIGEKAGKEAIAFVNTWRAVEMKSPVLTLADVREKKRKDAGHASLPELIFATLGTDLDRDNIVTLLRERHWTVRVTPKHISVTPPGKKKPRRWPWDTLLLQLEILRDACLRELDEKEPSRKHRAKEQNRDLEPE